MLRTRTPTTGFLPAGLGGDTWRTMAIAVAVSLAVLAAFSQYQQRTFDSYVHMFFADHYWRAWFQLWEPRWYGGFSVTSYPPFAHQLVAFLIPMFGHEGAFVVVMGAAVVAIPFAVGYLTPAFSNAQAASVAMYLIALWPTAFRFAYVYGQLPTLVATPLALWAMGLLHRYLKSGGVRTLVIYVAVVGTTAGTHHISIVFTALGCAIVGVRHLLIPEEGSSRSVSFVRAVIAAGGAAFIILSVVWPFLSLAAADPQVEIPHISREPIWERPRNMEWLEHILHFTLGGALTFAFLVFRQYRLVVLAVGIVFFTVLATGGTTPIPRFLFGAQWRWLTYDKFHHWGATLLAIGLGSFWTLVRPKQSSGMTRFAALLILPALLAISHKRADSLQPPFVKDIAPILKILNQEGAEKYRHLSLGFGDQFCRFSIFGKSPNVDGDYHTARNHPALRQSGIATLDASKYYEKGPALLKQVLSEADEHSLRWVLVYDDYYFPFLFDAGYELGEVWANGVAMFEHKGVSPIVYQKREPRWAAALCWGLMPSLCFLTACVTALSPWLFRRRDWSEV